MNGIQLWYTVSQVIRMTIEQALGELLMELRKQRGLSREQVAEATGVSAQSIGRIERGDVIAPWTSIWALARHYNIDFDALVEAAEAEAEAMREKQQQRLRSLRKIGLGGGETDSLTKPSANREFAGIVGFQKILP